MEREQLRQNQSERGEATNGTSPQTTPITTTITAPTPPPLSTPTPPRLTPNPALAPPVVTPTSSSPPPPLTPAPTLSTSYANKTMAGPTPSPHMLLPAPPKLTSTTNTGLRTYSRPILPSPGGGVSKTPSSPRSHSTTTTTSPAPAPSTLISSPPSTSCSVTSAASLPFPASATRGNMNSSSKTASVLTNGNTRSVPTSNSNPITPFHTPASPTGRQVSHPLGTPGLVRANQSSSHASQRVSQQTLLLGKSLKGSGQDQVLLRAQMLQNLTLRPPPPGTLTTPPSLRLKPPLRPRPEPSTTATEGQTTPTRHLAVPPPTLYSPVRAVPLRPRLHFANGQRVVSPRQSSTLQPIAAAPAIQASPISRQLVGLRSCPSSQASHIAIQSQPCSVSKPHPLTPSPHFEQSPSAARQLQIIALSSGRQVLSGNHSHSQSTVQPAPRVPEALQPSGLSQRTFGTEDLPPCPPNALKSKPTSPRPSPASLNPTSPPKQRSPQTHNTFPQGEKERKPRDAADQRDKERTTGQKQGTGDGREEKREGEKMREEPKTRGVERGAAEGQTEHSTASTTEEEAMEGIEEGQSEVEKRTGEEKEEDAMDQSEEPPGQNLCQHQHQEPSRKPSLDPLPHPEPSPDPKPVPAQVSVPAPGAIQEPPTPNQRLLDPPRDLPPISQEDLCEHMSSQSDNQSALSSLSSQSSPPSPFVIPPSENPPPLLAAQPIHPASNGLSQQEPENISQSQDETEHLDQSDDECEAFSQPESGPWVPKPWPEGGRQVLTHLVEGFVIQEGLQPFPVNRSSLLVQEPVNETQEPVNGTNEAETVPSIDTSKEIEQSTDSEGEGGETEGQVNTGPSHRDKAVLHCQFCGKRGHAHNFMRSKRFCSTSCARGFNVRLTKRLRALSAGSRSERPRPVLNRAESVPGKPLLLRLPRDLWSAGRREKEEKVEEVEEDKERRMEEEDHTVAVTTRMERRAARRARRASEPMVTTSSPTTTFKPGPAQWSVEEVTEFIHTLPGCSEVAEAFRVQEIDGQALLLLTEDHLMTSMNIKLGPALKICAHINTLRHQ